MEAIQTRAAPQCSHCGAQGVICQSQVKDPDGVIAESWNYRQCSNGDCGLVWLDPAPLASELWKDYGSYHTHTRSTQNRLSRALWSLCNRLLRWCLLPLWWFSGLQRQARQMRFLMLGSHRCGKLLDVGCGGGRYLHRMQRRGWQVEGIDFDAQATRRVSERYGIKTYTGDLHAAGLPDASLDAITMSHSIEHVVDPAATLTECWRILRPGGSLIILTPNVESRAAQSFGEFWRGWEPPRHLHLFSVQSMRQFLSAAGFRVQEVRSSADASAVVYRVSATLRATHHGQKDSFLKRLKLIRWSYMQELRDFRDQKAGRHVAQDLLAIAIKPGV